MERLFGAEDDQGRYVRPSGRRGLDHGISLIRYADDLVVTAPTREVLATYVVPKLTAFLGERGLKLNEAKTRIVRYYVASTPKRICLQFRKHNPTMHA